VATPEDSLGALPALPYPVNPDRIAIDDAAQSQEIKREIGG
jgi:hypothetical protein